MSEQRISFVIIILRGLGQITLQENAATGLLFLIGIFYVSVLMGLGAILAVCCGTITAKLLGYEKTEIEQGLYGFSAALVGVALLLYFKPVFDVWLLVIIGSVAAAVIQHSFIKRKIPVFTLPFVLVTWAILFLVGRFYPNVNAVSANISTPMSQDFTFALRGFGEVIFQGSVVSGSLFFIAVFINSPVAALYGLAGAVMAASLSAFFSAPVADVGMGLFSYNAVLCAIVFAEDKIKAGIWFLISVVLAVVIGLAMFKNQLIQLTFPFVAATCITLIIKSTASALFGKQKNAD